MGGHTTARRHGIDGVRLLEVPRRATVPHWQEGETPLAQRLRWFTSEIWPEAIVIVLPAHFARGAARPATEEVSLLERCGAHFRFRVKAKAARTSSRAPGTGRCPNH